MICGEAHWTLRETSMGRAPQAEGIALRWAVLVLSVTAGGAHPIRRLLQAGPASAPSGSLVAEAKQEDYSRPVCQFSVLGGGPRGWPDRPSSRFSSPVSTYLAFGTHHPRVTRAIPFGVAPAVHKCAC